jgi:hypothetical protein
MDNFIETFKSIWEIDIKSKFAKGLITYERQLQSNLYYQLKSRLSNDYEIFIEPVVYQLDGIKPDMIITKDSRIISIIELKSKPLEYPDFYSDMIKLERFKKELDVNQNIVFGWIPKSVDWYIQDTYDDLKLSYSIDKDLKLIMALILRHDSDIVLKDINDYAHLINIKDFMIFLGYLNTDETVEFKTK